jgi:hypothetical protein
MYIRIRKYPPIPVGFRKPPLNFAVTAVRLADDAAKHSNRVREPAGWPPGDGTGAASVVVQLVCDTRSIPRALGLW